MVTTTLDAKYYATRTDQPAEIVVASSKVTETDAIFSIHDKAMRARSDFLLLPTSGDTFAHSFAKGFFQGFLDGMATILRIPWPRRRK